MTESAQDGDSPGATAEDGGPAEGLQAPARSHPTRKHLKEFMQLLLRELLLVAPHPKQWLPLEVLLEVRWEGYCWAVGCGCRLGRCEHHKGRCVWGRV